MPTRYAPHGYARAWLKALDRLFWLPSRLLARVIGTAGRADGPVRPLRAANDNIGVLSARPANSNTPRRLA
ncbi:hypothetical protein STVA_42640 [Allostella vacuolata]|nr:hypothetical protein STVA_42640 [Stella vacuolata]